MKLKLWDVAKFPLAFLICSLIFFLLAYFFFPIVFQVVLYINTITIIISMFYAILFGFIPLFLKQEVKEDGKWELISIVIPVYNDAEILEQNLRNLVKLSYPNYEIIVVYSTKSIDRTEEVALKFAQEYENVHAIPESVSKPYAMNLGIDNAKGEYILFLDSDIFIFNGFIERALKFFSDENVVLVNSCFLSFNSAENLITRVSWGISNTIAFYGIGTNKFLKNVTFGGFGGVWRRSALIESGKFAIDSIIEDAELNLRISCNFPKWKGIWDDKLYCYQFYPMNFKTLYLQQMRWNTANYHYTVKGFFKVKGMGSRQKFLYISSFLTIVLFPMITYFSLGMIIIQFFANFFSPNIAFGGGIFYFLLAIISGFITFGTMFFFTYSKYRKNSRIKLSRIYIVVGVFVIMYLVGFIFAIVSLNSIKELVRKKKKAEVYIKVDKSEFRVPENGPNFGK